MVEFDIQINETVSENYANKARLFDEKLRGLTNKVARAFQKWVRKEAPRQTGALQSAVMIKSDSTGGSIFMGRGAPYFISVLEGHRTLTTDKSRRFWFALLRDKYGGNYSRKTKGSKGHVSPNEFFDRGYNAALPEVRREVQIFENWLVS